MGSWSYNVMRLLIRSPYRSAQWCIGPRRTQRRLKEKLVRCRSQSPPSWRAKKSNACGSFGEDTEARHQWLLATETCTKLGDSKETIGLHAHASTYVYIHVLTSIGIIVTHAHIYIYIYVCVKHIHLQLEYEAHRRTCRKASSEQVVHS